MKLIPKRLFVESDKDKSASEQLKRALDDYADSSRQVSTNNRYIAFGLVAITYTLLSSTSPSALAVAKAHGAWILFIGAVGCMGIIFDYLQYICATSVAGSAIINKTPGHKHEFRTKSNAYIWRQRFYVLRTCMSGLGAVLLIALIIMSWPPLAAEKQKDEIKPCFISSSENCI